MASGSSVQRSMGRAVNYHISPRTPLAGPSSCSALQRRTSSPQPPVTPPIGLCCSTPRISLSSGSPPALVRGPSCEEAFATRHKDGASRNTLPVGYAASGHDLRELVSREACERAYGQLVLSNKLREHQEVAANLQALLNSNFSELQKEFAELRATVTEKLSSHGSSRVSHTEGMGTEATACQMSKDAASSALQSTQEELFINERLQCTEVGLQEVRDALESLKQREDLRLQQDEVALRRLQDGLNGLSPRTDVRALVKCTDEDSDQQDALLTVDSWAGTLRFSSCSSVFRDADKESIEGNMTVSRSLDRRLQELRSENLQQTKDLEKEVKDELASLRGWVDAAIVAVISRLGLLERGHQTSASARGPELQQTTEGSRQQVLENYMAGREASSSSTATCSSSPVTRSCEGRSFSSGRRQQSMSPGTGTSDIPAPLTGSQRIQGLARSSQSQPAISGQASAGMALPQSLSLSARSGWAYANGCTQMAPTMPLVLPTCSTSNICGGASIRVRSCGPPNTARASFGIPSTATTTTVPGNGSGTPKVGGNVATNQAHTN